MTKRDPMLPLEWNDDDMAAAYLAGYNSAADRPGEPPYDLNDLGPEFGEWAYDHEKKRKP